VIVHQAGVPPTTIKLVTVDVGKQKINIPRTEVMKEEAEKKTLYRNTVVITVKLNHENTACSV
jgi:hypothetical protein